MPLKSHGHSLKTMSWTRQWRRCSLRRNASCDLMSRAGALTMPTPHSAASMSSSWLSLLRGAGSWTAFFAGRQAFHSSAQNSRQPQYVILPS